MTRAQTMDVVNDATSIQNEINALLNRVTLPIPDWDWSDPAIEWVPGDPLHTEPEVLYRYEVEDADGITHSVPVMQIPEEYDEDNNVLVGGQYIRPMIDWFDPDKDFNLNGHFMDCKECLVSGAYGEKECWVCGKQYSKIRYTTFEDSWRDAYEVGDAYRSSPNDVLESEANSFGLNSFRQLGWQGLTTVTPYYDPGDIVEDFNTTDVWDRIRGQLNDVSGAAAEARIVMEPFQQRMAQLYQAMAGSSRNVSIFMPRRHGRSMLQHHVSWLDELGNWPWSGEPRRAPARDGYRWVEHEGVWLELPVEIPMPSTSIPTPTDIQFSRSHIPRSRTDRVYPTSQVATQQRRGRNR